MIIIFEGVDGSGKSTLARTLGDKLGFPVYKDQGGIDLGMDPKDMNGHDRGSVRMAIATRADVIFDRSFPSEAVYGLVDNRGREMSQVRQLDAAVSQVPHLAVLVKLDSELEAIARRPEIEGWPKGAWDDYNDAYHQYVIAESLMNWITVDGAQHPNLQLESVMGELVSTREYHSDRDHVFMNIARACSARATCLSRRTSAVLVSATGHVISTGYNGVPTGVPHPTQCDRLRAGLESGQHLDGCLCGHAEENALVQAALNGGNPSGGTIYSLLSPCSRCARMIVNAGIKEVVYEKLYLDQRSLDMLAQSGVKVRQL